MTVVSPVVVETKEESVDEKSQNHGNSGEAGRKGHSLENHFSFVTPLVWPNIIMIFALHLFSLYGLLTFPYIYKLKTFCFGKFCFNIKYILSDDSTIVIVDISFDVGIKVKFGGVQTLVIAIQIFALGLSFLRLCHTPFILDTVK